MKLPVLHRTSLALAAAWLASASISATAPLTVDAAYKFHEPPLNSMGVAGLADLRGKPIVIDFWGRN
jgi:hypothetical protein